MLLGQAVCLLLALIDANGAEIILLSISGLENRYHFRFRGDGAVEGNMRIEMVPRGRSLDWTVVASVGRVELTAEAATYVCDRPLPDAHYYRLRLFDAALLTVYHSNRLVKENGRFRDEDAPIAIRYCLAATNSDQNYSEFANHRAGIIVFICLSVVVILLAGYLILRN